MDKHSFDVLLAEGLQASQQGRAETALDLFAQASALAPASGIPHFLIASEHAAAGNIDAAEAAFANAVLLAPDFALARYQLGLLQFSSQRAGVALVTWEPLLALAQTQALPHFVRGFADLAQDRFAEALAHFRLGLDCPDANPAVNADILQVVESVERLSQRQEPTHEGGGTGHVLLGGYRGGLH